MEITLLVKSIAGLVVVLAILMFLLFYNPNKKTPKSVEVKEESAPRAEAPSLEALRAIIKNKKSSSKELKEALDLVLKHYGNIHAKLGIRAHPDFDVYADMLFTICRHPHTNKDIIINFDKALETRNPEYKVEINNAITKGLNSRGV